MLDLNFYYQPPFDFEYKNYLILAYLSEVDASYALHKLSPYLLYTEKLLTELDKFQLVLNNFEKSIKKDMVGFSWKEGIIYSKMETLKEVNEIKEIVEYSVPLLQSKITIGYKLYKKYPQLLY